MAAFDFGRIIPRDSAGILQESGKAYVLEEYFISHDHLEIDGEPRLVIHECST